MPIINCESSLQIKWSKDYILAAGTVENRNPSFPINDTKLYVPRATLSTQENIKLLEQLSGINIWLKQQIKLKTDI